MKEEVERIKKLVGIDHNRWEQPCTCDKCKNMCKVPCIGTPKDIEAIIDARYAVCQPLSFYKSQQEIQKVNPLYAFKVATAYFREQGKVPVFEDNNCRLIKL